MELEKLARERKSEALAVARRSLEKATGWRRKTLQDTVANLERELGVTARTIDLDAINAAAEKAAADALAKRFPNAGKPDSAVQPEDLIPDGHAKRPNSTSKGENMTLRVKSPSEQYRNGGRLIGKHARTGEIVLDQRGAPVCLPDESDYAKAGVFLKHLAQRRGLNPSISEHESELFKEMVADDAWHGNIGNEWGTFRGERVKAVLGDSGGASGGENLTPAAFDESVITFPLLHSELLPYVTIKDVPRASSMEGASVSSPTLTWGSSEGSTFSLFSTASMVAAVNTSIFPVVCGVEFGRDLLSDSAIELGRLVSELIGERMKEELDNQICNGDGTTEPQGILNASGTNIIVQQSPSPTGWDLKDVEAILFGIGKQYRANKGPSVRWVMNDTSYRRIRQLAVSSTDQRRLFGMSHEDYMLLGRPVSIENNIANTDVAFVDLSRYRLYRRLGGETRFSDQGQTLMLKNTALLTFRGRYGGRLTDGAAMSEFNTGPSLE